jgi:hypothetical protein
MSAGIPAILTGVFNSFSYYFHAKAGMAPLLSHGRFPQIRHSSFIYLSTL